MTKKDYELVAGAVSRTRMVASIDKNAVRRQSKYAVLWLLATDLAETLAHDNPRFDPDKFKTACGL